MDDPDALDPDSHAADLRHYRDLLEIRRRFRRRMIAARREERERATVRAAVAATSPARGDLPTGSYCFGMTPPTAWDHGDSRLVEAARAMVAGRHDRHDLS